MLLEPKAREDTTIYRFLKFITDIAEAPIIWFRESVVLPNRKQTVWYHEQLRRVPTADECYTDDMVCLFEADQQFKRDRMVDNEILKILRRRHDNCLVHNRFETEVCKPLHEVYQNAITNFFIKYGDLGCNGTARSAYMKQKHRMIWERRHGPVGTGMKS